MKKLFAELRSERANLLLLFGLSLALLVLRARSLPLGLDEDMAAGRALEGNLLEAAALLQQPPLFVHLLWASLSLFGENLFALRVVPVVFGALQAPLAYLVTLRWSGNRVSAAAGGFLVLAAGPHFALAAEARPYSLASACLLLHLLQLSSPPAAPKERFAVLLSTSFLCLLSIGIQPLLVLASLALAFAAVEQQGRWHPLLALLAAFVLFLPVQWQAAGTYGTYLEGSLAALAGSSWGKLSALLPGALRPVAYGLPLLVPALFFAVNGNGQPLPLRRAFSLLFVAVLIALPGYALFLGGLAEWMQHPRYLSLLSLLVALLLACSLALCARNSRALRAWGLAVAALAATASVTRAASRPQETLWRDLYAYLQAADIASAEVFMLSVGTADSFNLEAPPGARFLLDGAGKQRLRLQSPWTRRERPGQVGIMLEAVERAGPEPAELVLVGMESEGTRALSRYRLSGVLEQRQLSGATVIRLRVEGGRKKTMLRLFTELGEQEKGELFKPRIYLGLAGLSALGRECVQARAWLGKAERSVAQRRNSMFDYPFVAKRVAACN